MIANYVEIGQITYFWCLPGFPRADEIKCTDRELISLTPRIRSGSQPHMGAATPKMFGFVSGCLRDRVGKVYVFRSQTSLDTYVVGVTDFPSPNNLQGALLQNISDRRPIISFRLRHPRLE